MRWLWVLSLVGIGFPFNSSFPQAPFANAVVIGHCLFLTSVPLDPIELVFPYFDKNPAQLLVPGGEKTLDCTKAYGLACSWEGRDLKKQNLTDLIMKNDPNNYSCKPIPPKEQRYMPARLRGEVAKRLKEIVSQPNSQMDSTRPDPKTLVVPVGLSIPPVVLTVNPHSKLYPWLNEIENIVAQAQQKPEWVLFGIGAILTVGLGATVLIEPSKIGGMALTSAALITFCSWVGIQVDKNTLLLKNLPKSPPISKNIEKTNSKGTWTHLTLENSQTGSQIRLQRDSKKMKISGPRDVIEVSFRG